MRKLRHIIAYTLNYKLYVLLNIVCNIAFVVFNLLSLLLFIPFLRLLFGETEPQYEAPEFSLTADRADQYFNYMMGNFVRENEELDSLLFICLIVIALFFLKTLFRYLAMFFLASVRHG